MAHFDGNGVLQTRRLGRIQAQRTDRFHAIQHDPVIANADVELAAYLRLLESGLHFGGPGVRR
jgi:hypothetical protein